VRGRRSHHRINPFERCDMNKITTATMAALVMASAYASAKVTVTA
jgi:hypothetical protein